MKDLIIETLENMKASEIVSLDVTKLTSIADTMIIASGNSSRHVAAIAMEAKQVIKQEELSCPVTISGLENPEWVLIDAGSIIIHIMIPKIRDFYALEKLWDPNVRPANSSQ